MSSPLKPPRQATACEWCRAHKLKCDAEQPSCRNCARRSVQCVTTDLRRPNAQGLRTTPVGRRQRTSRASSHPSQSSKSKTPQSTDTSTDTSPYTTLTTLPPVAEYPPSPEQPGNRSFAPRSPERLLPGLFSAPFDREGTDQDRAISNKTLEIQQQQPVARASGTSGHSNSHHVLVQWLDLFFMQNTAWEPVYPHFRQGLAYTAEVPLPPLVLGAPSPTLPEMPPQTTLDGYVLLFFAHVHPLFPILERTSFTTSLADLKSNTHALTPSECPLLACAYAVCSLAADEQAAAVTPAGTRYLEAICFLYAHLMALPYLSSVQALLLLTLVLRNRNKDAAAWGALGQAIRLAQSIGLHRRQTDATDNTDLASRVWWTAYILGRTMELETGRPSTIRDDECDQVLPTPRNEGMSVNYFSALIGLAKIRARVGLLMSGSITRNRPVRDLLFEMGHLDRTLLDWADAFPESVRPGRDLICGGPELPLATYVSLQYHQTVIALNRPALLSTPGFLRNRINKYCAGTPLRDRLHFSLCLGAASARTMLKAVNDLGMYAAVPGHIARVVTADQILLAVLVLGIYVAKVPMSRLNRADLALVDTFGALVEDEYRQAGHGEALLRGITLFQSQLRDYIAGLQGRRTEAQVETMPATVTTTGGEADPTDVVDDFGFDLAADGDVMNLEASWAHFWDEDFEKLLVMPLTDGLDTSSLDMTSTANMTMYLLGIPQSWP